MRAFCKQGLRQLVRRDTKLVIVRVDRRDAALGAAPSQLFETRRLRGTTLVLNRDSALALQPALVEAPRLPLAA